jgi:hypothetical protein
MRALSWGIYCNSSYGPIFGNNYDIYVSDNCNINASNYTNLGWTFANDTGIPGDQVFTGERNFTVKEIEIFAILSALVHLKKSATVDMDMLPHIISSIQTRKTKRNKTKS